MAVPAPQLGTQESERMVCLTRLRAEPRGAPGGPEKGWPAGPGRIQRRVQGVEGEEHGPGDPEGPCKPKLVEERPPCILCVESSRAL